MKCHCGLECEVKTMFEYPIPNPNYYYCDKHGFQGWVNTEGFEYLE